MMIADDNIAGSSRRPFITIGDIKAIAPTADRRGRVYRDIRASRDRNAHTVAAVVCFGRRCVELLAAIQRRIFQQHVIRIPDTDHLIRRRVVRQQLNRCAIRKTQMRAAVQIQTSRIHSTPTFYQQGLADGTVYRGLKTRAVIALTVASHTERACPYKLSRIICLRMRAMRRKGLHQCARCKNL